MLLCSLGFGAQPMTAGPALMAKTSRTLVSRSGALRCARRSWTSRLAGEGGGHERVCVVLDSRLPRLRSRWAHLRLIIAQSRGWSPGQPTTGRVTPIKCVTGQGVEGLARLSPLPTPARPPRSGREGRDSDLPPRTRRERVVGDQPFSARAVFIPSGPVISSLVSSRNVDTSTSSTSSPTASRCSSSVGNPTAPSMRLTW